MVDFEHPRLQFFTLFPKEEWVFISMQNVRSLQYHLQDTLKDPIIMSSSIIAFTETCVQSSDWPGWSNFSDYTVYQRCRSDVAKDTNVRKRKSGGVALLVKNNMISEAENSYNDKTLEMATLNTRLLPTNEPMTVSLIYKDHDMNNAVFLSKLTDVLNNHQKSNAIVLGDFNIDMNKDNSLQNCAAKSGFSPLVSCDTTINNSLLDQVFVNSKALFQNAQISHLNCQKI